MTSFYGEWPAKNETLEIGIDDVDILIRGTDSHFKAIGTKGLNACTCVVILGESAIILAHISPYPGDFDANTSQDLPHLSYLHHESSLTTITNLMERHMEHFPPSTTAWGVFATNQESGPMQSVIDQVRDSLGAVNVDMRSVLYQEADVQNILFRKGEIVSSFTEDNKPQLILERAKLWPQIEGFSQSSTLESWIAVPSAAGLSAAGPAMWSATSRALPQMLSPQAWSGYPLRTTNEGATMMSCIIFGLSMEVAAVWLPATSVLPMIWICNNWLQTETRPDDNVLAVRALNGALVRIERPMAWALFHYWML